MAGTGGRFKFGVQAAQILPLRFGGTFGDDAGRIAFEQPQQVIDVPQVLFGDFGDVGAAPHLHRDQAFGRQHLERLAQRRAADAVFLRQLEFVDPAARFELAPEDALTQQFRHLFVECARCQGEGGHGAQCTSKRRLN